MFYLFATTVALGAGLVGAAIGGAIRKVRTPKIYGR